MNIPFPSLFRLAPGFAIAAGLLLPGHAFAAPEKAVAGAKYTKYTDYSKSGQKIGSYATLAAAEITLNEYPGGSIKDGSGHIVYQEPDFTTVDLRYSAPAKINAGSINKFLLQHGSPLDGLGASFMYAQRVYGVSASYLLSHAIEESNWGRSLFALSRNNLYGTGAYDSNPDLAGSFPSLDYAILYQAWVVRKNYLNPGYSHYVSPTLAGISQNYASDVHWADNIRAVMNQLALFVGDNVKSYRQYKPGTPDPTPIVMTEPTYHVSGARGLVKKDLNYTGAPVYPTIGTGQLQMFSRNLQFGDVGDDVTTLQTSLNKLNGAGIDVSGRFDSATQTALQAFQTSKGLPPTGVCDFDLWTQDLDLPAPTLLPTDGYVEIDEIAQGMVGALVVNWYHVPGRGWVSARDVSLSNVFRVTARHPKLPTDATISVYDSHHQAIASLHSGDTVVCQTPSWKNGEITIQYGNGVGHTGVLKESQASLKVVH